MSFHPEPPQQLGGANNGAFVTPDEFRMILEASGHIPPSSAVSTSVEKPEVEILYGIPSEQDVNPIDPNSDEPTQTIVVNYNGKNEHKVLMAQLVNMSPNSAVGKYLKQVLVGEVKFDFLVWSTKWAIFLNLPKPEEVDFNARLLHKLMKQDWFLQDYKRKMALLRARIFDNEQNQSDDKKQNQLSPFASGFGGAIAYDEDKGKKGRKAKKEKKGKKATKQLTETEKLAKHFCNAQLKGKE